MTLTSIPTPCAVDAGKWKTAWEDFPRAQSLGAILALPVCRASFQSWVEWSKKQGMKCPLCCCTSGRRLLSSTFASLLRWLSPLWLGPGMYSCELCIGVLSHLMSSNESPYAVTAQSGFCWLQLNPNWHTDWAPAILPDVTPQLSDRVLRQPDCLATTAAVTLVWQGSFPSTYSCHIPWCELLLWPQPGKWLEQSKTATKLKLLKLCM